MSKWESRGKRFPTAFDSEREKEQEKKEPGMKPSRLRTWLQAFPAADAASWRESKA